MRYEWRWLTRSARLITARERRPGKSFVSAPRTLDLEPIRRVPIALFVVIISVSACCAETPIRTYSSVVDLFVLVPHEADSDQSFPADFRVTVEPENHRFILTIENLSADPITLEPNSSFFVDEAGRRHSLKFDIYDAHRPSLRISPGSTLRVDAAPKSKISVGREHCFSEFRLVEPLVPWSVQDASNEQVEKRLEELAKTQTPIGLLLSFHGESRGVIRISRRFILRPRWATEASRA